MEESLNQPNTPSHLVAVVGAGPAGLYVAKELSKNHEVVLINRDIKPGGLAEYGIYPDKTKIRQGLKTQFREILARPNVHYFGHLNISCQGDLKLKELRQMGFQAVVVTVGAQHARSLGIPGEELQGVYHAKDLVYHYSGLPPFSQQPFPIGRRVAVIGMGNVMLDITRYLTRVIKVDEVIAIARRGPGEIKFDKAELEGVAASLDVEAFEKELRSHRELMLSLGQNPEEIRGMVLSAVEKAEPPVSNSRFSIRFLLSPSCVMGDGSNHVCGLELERNTLFNHSDEYVSAKGTGEREMLPVDTIIFAIGNRVENGLGLPTRGSSFISNPNPRFPVHDISYEIVDENGDLMEDIFVAGWARQASTGLVGLARRDSINAARAVSQYLQTLPPHADIPGALQSFHARAASLQHPVITNADLRRLEDVEDQLAAQKGVEEFKFTTNEEMLATIGLSETQKEPG